MDIYFHHGLLHQLSTSLKGRDRIRGLAVTEEPHSAL